MGIDSRPPTGFSSAGGERPVGTPVAVAMSGGVDSSMGAALLLEWGYDVTGVTMCLWAEPEAGESASSSASGEGAVQNVRRVCDALRIPLRIVDFRAAFKSAIVDYFIETYSRGLTPNPCVACNEHIKFGLLLDYVREQGIDLMATGHCPRPKCHSGRPRLRIGTFSTESR